MITTAALLLTLIQIKPGQKISLRTEVQAANGKMVKPFGTSLTAMIFVLRECPRANEYAPEITRIASKYTPKGVRFYLVYVDSDVTSPQAERHSKDFGYSMPNLLDPHHAFTKSLAITVSPEAVLVGKDGRLLYRGRIDDRYPEPGKPLAKPVHLNFRDALESALSGNPVLVPETKAVGCIIGP